MLTESCVMFFSPSLAVLSPILRDEYILFWDFGYWPLNGGLQLYLIAVGCLSYKTSRFHEHWF